MPTRFQQMKDSPAWDAANGAAAGGFLVSFLAGVDWPAAAAFATFVYMMLLSAEKLVKWLQKWRTRRCK